MRGSISVSESDETYIMKMRGHREEEKNCDKGKAQIQQHTSLTRCTCHVCGGFVYVPCGKKKDVIIKERTEN